MLLIFVLQNTEFFVPRVYKVYIIWGNGIIYMVVVVEQMFGKRK